MLRNRIYYGVKPFVPKPVRMAIRRHFALRRRPQVADIWPIMRGSERPPQGWAGWPEGKKFAVVLTHDVEGPSGLDKCRALMELEMELGFRSSFNFIPEGTYRVPADLRAELAQNGFEVGVHDLKHDGRLFRSRAMFRARAVRINQYLRAWNAVGFRSGFMLHQLDWLHDLEIEYDMSTFDTDPFEPQPEGRNTIFPVWVPRPATNHWSPVTDHSRSGYVELPYTLPQDSTLFFLLREQNADIWLRKLDWIAGHGGMALVNVHPDYLRFPGDPTSSKTYDVESYRRLLEHLRSNHGSCFWQALPNRLAEHVRQLETPPVIRRRKRVCMVTHSFYLSDNRVMRYAKALAARGDDVDVVSLRHSPDQPQIEVCDGVRVIRIQDRFAKTERSKAAYLLPLLRFLFKASAWVTRSHVRSPYDLLHIHNVPDFMVFAGWYPKLTGKPIILDIHDIVPEFFASKFQLPHKGIFFSLLGRMERWSAAFADHIIIANHLWLDKYSRRTGTEGRITPLINHVDSDVFFPQLNRQRNGKQIILFPGGLQWHQGVDIAIEAFARVREQLPKAEFHIYGDGNAKRDLLALAQQLNLNGSVRFFDTITAGEVARVMAEADLGVVPKRADSFGNEAYSTKIMEFMSVGVPVIVSETRIDRHYFDDSVVRFFESGNVDALARQILDLLGDPESAQSLVANGLAYAAENSWKNRSANYLKLIDGLCANEKPPVAALYERRPSRPDAIPAAENRG